MATGTLEIDKAKVELLGRELGITPSQAKTLYIWAIWQRTATNFRSQVAEEQLRIARHAMKSAFADRETRFAMQEQAFKLLG